MKFNKKKTIEPPDYPAVFSCNTRAAGTPTRSTSCGWTIARSSVGRTAPSTLRTQPSTTSFAEREFQIPRTEKNCKNSDAVPAESRRRIISASARSIASSYVTWRLITLAGDRGSRNRQLHSTSAERATNLGFGTRIPHLAPLAVTLHRLQEPSASSFDFDFVRQRSAWTRSVKRRRTAERCSEREREFEEEILLYSN